MKSTYSITEAQSSFPRLVRESAGGAAVAIARHGETVAYLVSKARFEALLETLELTASRAARRAVEADRDGRARFQPLKVLDA